MRKILFISIVLIESIFWGCAKGEKEIELKGDSGEIKCTVGEKVKVAIESNPTTGYRWQMSKSTNIKLINIDYKAYKVGENVCGSGGIEIFEIKPEKRCEETIKFSYAREWEKGVKAEQIKTLKIVAE